MALTRDDGSSEPNLQEALAESESPPGRSTFPIKFALVPTVLGLLLLTASGLKAYELATQPVAEQDLLSTRWFLMAVVEFELALGLWLLSGFRPDLARWAALIVFSVFSLVTAFRAVNGEPSCGCFGVVSVNPWRTLGIDLAAMGALIWWRPIGTSSTTSGLAMLRVTAILVIFLVVGIPVGVAIASFRPAELTADGEIVGTAGPVILEPEKWAGRNFPLRKHIDIGEELMQGRWVVVLFRSDCVFCRDEVPRYTAMAVRMARYPGAPRVAFVEVPPFGHADFLPASDGSPCRIGKLREGTKWFASTPDVIFLGDGVVRPVPEGEGWLRPYQPQ